MAVNYADTEYAFLSVVTQMPTQHLSPLPRRLCFCLRLFVWQPDNLSTNFDKFLGGGMCDYVVVVIRTTMWIQEF